MDDIRELDPQEIGDVTGGGGTGDWVADAIIDGINSAVATIKRVTGLR